MIALKYLKARHIEIDKHKVNKGSIQAAVWRDQMQYIEISEEIHTLRCPVSSCGVAKKQNRCMQNLHCKCIYAIFRPTWVVLNASGVMWLMAAAKSLEMAHGLGGLIMVGMGMVARSNHGGQEWAIRWPAHKERALTNSCQVDLTQADLTSYPPPRFFMLEPTGRHR